MKKWLERFYKHCYCAFCRRPRRVYSKRHLSWTDVLATLALSLVMTGVIWRGLEPKGVVVFAILLICGEMLIHWRWRLGLRCGHCGFDPLIYIRNPEKASAQVRAFYERRREQTDFLLTGQALVETQRRIQDGIRSRDPYGLAKTQKPVSHPPVARPGGKILSRTV